MMSWLKNWYNSLFLNFRFSAKKARKLKLRPMPAPSTIFGPLLTEDVLFQILQVVMQGKHEALVFNNAIKIPINKFRNLEFTVSQLNGLGYRTHYVSGNACDPSLLIFWDQS
jgi:hypothetical protein